jgi:hypothetical protein
VAGSVYGDYAARLSRPVEIVNANSGLCLTIAGGDTAQNATAVQYTCDTDPSRRWRAIRGNNGSYQLVNVNSGLALVHIKREHHPMDLSRQSAVANPARAVSNS